MKGQPRWEHFSHQADIGVRGIGTSREEAFEQAALALTAVVTDPQIVRPEEAVEIACEAPDDELLLVEWLNALIYEMGTRHMLWSRFTVRIERCQLRATAWGRKSMWPGTGPPSRSKARPIRTCQCGKTNPAHGWRNAWWMSSARTQPLSWICPGGTARNPPSAWMERPRTRRPRYLAPAGSQTRPG